MVFSSSLGLEMKWSRTEPEPTQSGYGCEPEISVHFESLTS